MGSEGSDGHGLAGRRVTRVDDVDLAMSEDSDSDTDPVMLGRRRQLPKIPSALPFAPSETPELPVPSPMEGSRRHQLPKIPSALPFIPDEMPELPVSSIPCPGNCGFKVIWHQTHCCNMCSQSPGVHG